MPELRITIPDDLDQRLQTAMPEYLDRKGFVCLLLDKALDTPATLTERAAASVVSKSSSSTSKETSKKKSLYRGIVKGDLPEELSPYRPLIEEFWRGKKGAKSETAWGLLIDNLGKIRSKYGAQVLEEQLKLGINAKWSSVTLSNYEKFAVKGATAAQPESRHPAAKVFTAKDFDGPKSGGVLSDLGF